MWEFAVVLFLMDVQPSSLLLPSLFALVESLARICASPRVGAMIDRWDRLKAGRCALALQNGSILLCALCVWALVQTGIACDVVGNERTVGGTACSTQDSSVAYHVLLGFLMVSGAGAVVGSSAHAVSFELDWVATMASDPDELADMNATMRRLDLVCKLAAPAAVGVLMDNASVTTSSLVVALWNLGSFGAEYALQNVVYQRCPELWDKMEPEGKPPSAGWGRSATVFSRQVAAVPAFCLAILYCSVLNFGPQQVGYLKWRGVSQATLGWFRGSGALLGVVSTIIFPKFRARIGTPATAVLGGSAQVIFLLLCVVAAGLKHRDVEEATAWLQMIGVALSRFGLWMFDLSVTQIITETVPARERGTFGGALSAMQNMFFLLVLLGGVVWHEQTDFWGLALVSFACVVVSAVLFVVWFRRSRNKDLIAAGEELQELSGAQVSEAPLLTQAPEPEPAGDRQVRGSGYERPHVEGAV